MNIPIYTHILFLIILGGIAGILYGFSFVIQHQGLFSSSIPKSWAYRFAFFLLRIGILIGLGNYLLQAPPIVSILGSLGFFIAFWLIILQVKARSYERT